MSSNHPTSHYVAEASTLLRVPRHVAVIMDGNGRWAQSRGLERTAGHVKGVDTVRLITEAARHEGVEFLTLYAFSTENWKRPQYEVDALMHLIVTAIERETPDLIKNGVRLQVIGDIDRMPDEARDRLLRCIADTSQCSAMTLSLALSYSSHWDLTQATRRIAVEVASGALDAENITADTITSHLSTASLPAPDLLIRTGGERRISNFLLWEIAYAEFYFTDTFWPDFSKEEFRRAIEEYSSRERRYGLTSQQLRH